MIPGYDPNPKPNNSNDAHTFDDTDVSEFAHHHTLGYGPGQALSMKLAQSYTKWKAPTLSSGLLSNELFIGLDVLGFVHFKGSITATSAKGAGATLFLVTGLIPHVLSKFIVPYEATFTTITIQTNTIVSAATALAVGEKIYFDGLTYPNDPYGMVLH